MLPRTLSARALTLLFAAALLWAQMLGLAHAVLHGPQVQAAGTIHEAHAPDSGGGATSRTGLLGHLLGHADRQDAPDCQLWDHLAQATALVAVPALLLPQLVPLFLVQAPVPPLAIDFFAPYGARAPPKLG